LLDKLVLCMINSKVCGDLIKIGKNRRKQTEYSGAMNKLVEGNLIVSVEIKKNGAKAKKHFRKHLKPSRKRRK
jgi:hypothetical protein